MPTYYFHVADDLYAEDSEGRDFPDVEAARRCAIEGCRDLAASCVRQGHLNLDHRVEVRDAAGNEVLSVSFRDAIEIGS